jgi:DNA-binding IclR family transcriptional regulator
MNMRLGSISTVTPLSAPYSLQTLTSTILIEKGIERISSDRQQRTIQWEKAIALASDRWRKSEILSGERNIYLQRVIWYRMADQNNEYPIKTTAISFEIVHVLQQEGPCRLSEIASQLEIAESTVHRHLKTLHLLRYVSRSGQKYQIGLRFARLGEAARTRNEAFHQVKDRVRVLAEETGERAQFVVEDHGLGVYLYLETGNKAVQAGLGVGRQIHLHCSSAGKAILSRYSRERVDEILDRWGLPEQTEQTIADREAYYEELEQIRARGVAFNEEEHIHGINAVAVPVHDADEKVLGAFCVSAPSHRMKGELFKETIPDLLLGSANALELNLVYSDPESTDDVVVE